MSVLIWGVIILVLIFLIPNLIDAGKRKREDAIRQKRRQQINEDKQDRFDQLVEKYKRSPLMNEILEFICDEGDKNKYPHWITVTNHEIQSGLDGRTITYNFERQRVGELQDIDITYPHLEFQAFEINDVHLNGTHIEAFFALATAINEQMNNEYVINIEDNRAYMKLKPKKHF